MSKMARLLLNVQLIYTVDELFTHLRKGGFTIPFLKKAQRHFENVAKQTGTPQALPLSLSVYSWALYWLVECVKGMIFPFISN